MIFQQKCSSCGKLKWFVKIRSLTPKGIGIALKSDKKFCGRCFKLLRRHIFKVG